MVVRYVRRGAVIAATTAALVATSVLGTAGSAAGEGSGSSGSRSQAAAGFARDARCGNALIVAGVEGVHCTHGPDPAPAGVDVDHRPTTDELREATTSASSSTTTGGGVGCYGDGSSGKRVQAVYARAADVADRYADLSSLIGQWAAATDAVFADSAAETGGIRHIRWVTDASCALVVQRVQLSTSGDDNMSNSINELRALGLNRTDRKYLVWMDAGAYCGIAEFRNDDQPDASNANNSGPSIARVDNICWGRQQPVEAHELMHTLGGVQDSAPHSTGQAHCTDAEDLMCYADSSGMAMNYVCPSTHGRLFDCNHDDYFSTSPPVGSYLATHWNTASSGFVAATAPDATSTGTSSTGTSTTADPLTATFSGTLSRKSPTASFWLQTGTGSLTATVRNAKRGSLTASVVEPDGRVLATGSGSSVTLATPVSAGSHRIVVSNGGASATFSVDVAYPAP